MTEPGSQDSAFSAIAAANNMKAIFYGGYTRLTQVTGYDKERAIAARLDVDTGVVRWLKTYINPDNTNTEMISAMAVNPAEDKLAMYITRMSLNEYEDVGWLLVVNTNDGGYASKLLGVNLGSGVNHSRGVVWNQGLKFDAYDRVYAAAETRDRDVQYEAHHQLVIWNYKTDLTIFK